MHRAQEELVGADPTQQLVVALAVGVEQCVVAVCTIHYGADPGEDAVVTLRTQHRHVGQLNAGPGQGGIGGRVELGLGAGGVDRHTEDQIQLAPARLPVDHW